MRITLHSLLILGLLRTTGCTHADTAAMQERSGTAAGCQLSNVNYHYHLAAPTRGGWPASLSLRLQSRNGSFNQSFTLQRIEVVPTSASGDLERVTGAGVQGAALYLAGRRGSLHAQLPELARLGASLRTTNRAATGLENEGAALYRGPNLWVLGTQRIAQQNNADALLGRGEINRSWLSWSAVHVPNGNLQALAQLPETRCSLGIASAASTETAPTASVGTPERSDSAQQGASNTAPEQVVVHQPMIF